MDFLKQCRVFQKDLYNFESLYKIIQKICTVFCHNVEEHTEFYLG
jgi:hypothetical protein